MTLQNVLKKTLIILVFFLCLVFFTGKITAQSEITKLPDNKLGIRISPSVYLVHLNENHQEEDINIQITNINSFDIYVNATIKDYNYISSNVEFVDVSDADFPLTPWISEAQDEYFIKNGESVIYKTKVRYDRSLKRPIMQGSIFFDVKLDAEENSNYNQTTLDQGITNIGASVGCLIFVSVDDSFYDVPLGGEITEFKSMKKVWTSTPLFFDLLYKNTSSYGFIPEGRVVVENLVGTKIDEAILDYHYILPLSESVYNFNWPASNKNIGFYWIKAEITDGNGDLDVEKELVFVVPKYVLGILISVILILVAIHIVRKIRKKTLDFK